MGDKVIGEWKTKVDSLSYDLDVSQKETRNASSDLFKVKSAYEESVLQLDEVRRENKTLSNEIKDIMDQISEGGKNIHEIDKIRKRLEAEKLELQSALEEAEATLEQEENKVLRCQLELNAVRQEIERRLAEKEEEFILVKKAQSKALDSMQVALETETKSKAEALRMKKAMIKMETRIRELESELDAETRRFGDVTKNLRKSERSIKELSFAADEDRKNHERMQALIDQLQGKVKSYKKQIEEAEEIAALNLAKYRKVAGSLGDAE